MENWNNIDIKEFENKVILINKENPSWISLSKEGYNLFNKIETFGIENYIKLQNSTNLKEEINFYNEVAEELFSPIKDNHIVIDDLSLTVFLTTSCNFQCKHCFYGCGKNNHPTTLKYNSNFENFIDEFYMNGGKHVTFTGGEPLLNRDIKKFIQYVYSKGLSVALLTNGSLLTDEICEILATNNVVLQVSLDGNETDFKKIRNGGIFNNVIQGLQLLKKYNIKYDISFMPCNLNKNSIYDVIEIAKKYNAYGIHMPIFEEYGTGKDNAEILKLSNKEYIDFFSSLIKDYFNGKMNTVHINMIDNIINDLMYATRRSSCKLGSKVISLYSNGDIFPCSEFIEDNFKIGNYSNGFPNIEKNKLIERLKCNNINTIKKCQSCTYKHYCGAGCRLHSYIKFNSLSMEDSNCELIFFLYDKILEYIS